MAKEYSKYGLSYIYDNPVTYKDLVIYPVTMRDYLQFAFYSECMTLDKNSVNDVKIISMTYLDYMYSLDTKEKPYIAFFDAILKLVTKKNDLVVTYARNKKNKPVFIVDEHEYNASDFEEIKNIICEYNMVELPDETIQKEIRDNIKTAQELRRKSSGKMASLEDQFICIMISSNLNLEQIYDLSIRKFTKTLERADAQLHYKIYLSASMSGMVEFKDKSFIKHWMSDLTKTKLDLVPFEQIKDTMAGKPSSAKNAGKSRKK